MAIDRTPVLKRCRQLGIDPAELGYSSKKESIRQPKRRRKESEYGMQLREKQKVKFIYGVLEKQFHGYFNKARKMNGVTGENLMIILESRLDNVVFRLGFARTRKEARQSVRHGHFTVNGKRVDIPSYRVKAGDVVAVGEKFRDLLPIKEALISSERFEVLAGSRSISRSCLVTCSLCRRVSRSAVISTSSSSSSSTLSSPSGLLRLEVIHVRIH